MKKVSLFFFALALSLSATVVNAQQPPVLSEQEMRNINPSSWTGPFKQEVKGKVAAAYGRTGTTPASNGPGNRTPTTEGRSAGTQPPVNTEALRIATTLVASLTPQQKQQIEGVLFQTSSSGLRNQGGNTSPSSCSGLKYSDFWFALGVCIR